MHIGPERQNSAQKKGVMVLLSQNSAQKWN
jgi:hypothetical protein